MILFLKIWAPFLSPLHLVSLQLDGLHLHRDRLLGLAGLTDRPRRRCLLLLSLLHLGATATKAKARRNHLPELVTDEAMVNPLTLPDT